MSVGCCSSERFDVELEEDTADDSNDVVDDDDDDDRVGVDVGESGIVGDDIDERVPDVVAVDDSRGIDSKSVLLPLLSPVLLLNELLVEEYNAVDPVVMDVGIKIDDDDDDDDDDDKAEVADDDGDEVIGWLANESRYDEYCAAMPLTGDIE
jgi:hypothetical protein